MSKPENTDHVWARAEIESPCVKVCVIHPAARLCTGCLRSIDEIAQWSRMTPEARRAVMAELPGRAGQLTQRRGGRAARLGKAD
jgi:Predicted Fe-S protein